VDAEPNRAASTREQWEQQADRMLAAVRPYAAPGKGLIHLPGPESRSGRWSDGLEGFARTFLLAGFRLSAAEPGSDPNLERLAAWYAAGLETGADPDSTGRWPTLAEVGQAKVECASIALALHESRRWIWDTLSPRARVNLVTWMSGMLGTPVPDNNWVWFRAVTEAFLRSVGGPWSKDDIEYAQARTEDWYAGEGWYSDGEPAPGELRNFDYYNGWALHFYPLWYCRISGPDAEPGLLDRYRARLRRYLDDARHLVGADGAPLMQGRSLTYRFAMLAPFWAGAVFDATVLPPGQTRRLANSVLRYFVRSGAFDERGLLPIGWHGPFEAMREDYSGSGSPYWASKGFAGLVLPPDHPAWTAAEEPLPIERGDFTRTLRRAAWIVSGTKSDGVVRVAQHGADHSPTSRLVLDEPVYARHGYSTHAAPEYRAHYPLDSHIALIAPDGRASHRRPARPMYLGDGVAVSRHRVHWWRGQGPLPNYGRGAPGEAEFDLGPWLTTASAVHGPLEVRLARIDPWPEDPVPGHPHAPDAATAASSGPWRLRFGGWALAGRETLKPRYSSHCCWAMREHDALASTIAGLRGNLEPGWTGSRDSNPLGPNSLIPWLATAGDARVGEVYAVLVVLSGSVAGPTSVHGIMVEAHPDGSVSVSWPDRQQTNVPLRAPRYPVT
jgi:hypothetical protein